MNKKRFGGRLLFSLVAVLACTGIVSAQQDTVQIQGESGPSFSADAAVLKSMPRKQIEVKNPHSGKIERYEGVLLAELLKKVNAPSGDAIRGKEMTICVLAEARDGYRVVFTLAELDSAFQDSNVLVADTLDGKPLDPGFGPFRLVAPLDKRPARWIRMLARITVFRLKGTD